MATVLDTRVDSARAYLGVKFYVTDEVEGGDILAGAQQVVLDYLESQGFYPDGVDVRTEVT